MLRRVFRLSSRAHPGQCLSASHPERTRASAGQLAIQSAPGPVPASWPSRGSHDLSGTAGRKTLSCGAVTMEGCRKPLVFCRKDRGRSPRAGFSRRRTKRPSVRYPSRKCRILRDSSILESEQPHRTKSSARRPRGHILSPNQRPRGRVLSHPPSRSPQLFLSFQLPIPSRCDKIKPNKNTTH